MIFDTEIILKLFFAALAASFIGLERKSVHKPAGIRTHMLVCVGSALFTIIAIDVITQDVPRVMAGIITGIGFLGAGTIFRSEDHVQGLTTAASVWAVAAIGIAAGLGEYFIMIVSTILVITILQLNQIGLFRDL
ncbi:MgtC/SapB family protein [Candidatus Woesearchaeota archaeon]|nr:MgtC/SapB family protein [Candidatus Woesearchaeota archaeon]